MSNLTCLCILIFVFTFDLVLQVVQFLVCNTWYIIVDESLIHRWSIVHPWFIHRLSTVDMTCTHIFGWDSSQAWEASILQCILILSTVLMCMHFHFRFDIQLGTTSSIIFWYVTNHIIIVDAFLIYRWSTVDPTLIQRWSTVNSSLIHRWYDLYSHIQLKQQSKGFTPWGRVGFCWIARSNLGGIQFTKQFIEFVYMLYTNLIWKQSSRRYKQMVGAKDTNKWSEQASRILSRPKAAGTEGMYMHTCVSLCVCLFTSLFTVMEYSRISWVQEPSLSYHWWRFLLRKEVNIICSTACF